MDPEDTVIASTQEFNARQIAIIEALKEQNARTEEENTVEIARPLQVEIMLDSNGKVDFIFDQDLYRPEMEEHMLIQADSSDEPTRDLQEEHIDLFKFIRLTILNDDTELADMSNHHYSVSIS